MLRLRTARTWVNLCVSVLGRGSLACFTRPHTRSSLSSECDPVALRQPPHRTLTSSAHSKILSSQNIFPREGIAMHSCHVAGIGCRPSACATSPATGNNVQPERTRPLTGETDGAPVEKPDLHAYSMLERRDSTATYPSSISIKQAWQPKNLLQCPAFKPADPLP